MGASRGFYHSIVHNRFSLGVAYERGPFRWRTSTACRREIRVVWQNLGIGKLWEQVVASTIRLFTTDSRLLLPTSAVRFGGGRRPRVVEKSEWFGKIWGSASYWIESSLLPFDFSQQILACCCLRARSVSVEDVDRVSSRNPSGLAKFGDQQAIGSSPRFYHSIFHNRFSLGVAYERGPFRWRTSTACRREIRVVWQNLGIGKLWEQVVASTIRLFTTDSRLVLPTSAVRFGGGRRQRVVEKSEWFGKIWGSASYWIESSLLPFDFSQQILAWCCLRARSVSVEDVDSVSSRNPSGLAKFGDRQAIGSSPRFYHSIFHNRFSLGVAYERGPFRWRTSTACRREIRVVWQNLG